MNGVRKAKRKGKSPKVSTKNSSIYVPEAQRVKYIESYLTALIQDAKCIFHGHYSNADATLDCKRIVMRLRSEGSGFATRTLPELAKGMFSFKEHGVASFPQFRLQRGTEHPAFLGRLFNLALYSVDQNLRVKAVDFIYSFSVSFKKLKGEYPKKVVRKLFADFCKTDVDLKQIDFFSKDLRLILEDARAQWRIFAAETNLAELIEASTPQPGPGATNSPTEKNMRYRPHVLYRQIDNVMPYMDWFYPNQMYVFVADGTYDGLFNATVASPTARFKDVPKTAGVPRGICIEENEMQVCQQAVRKAMYKAITMYFGDNIALQKQRVNGQLALKSSETLEHATIDESEASDRVARLLVSILSQDDMKVHNMLMGLSTRWVIPPDVVKDEFPSKVATEKYAPMGSALCFPVMSLVHMFLVRAIIRLSTKEDTRSACNNVFVYGDDIILPSEYVERVFTYLPKFGMKLNVNKSFYRSHFRESCGVHAYHGVDITPVYVKYIPFPNCTDALASAFAVERQLFDKEFHNTASMQRSEVDGAYGPQPDVPEGLSLVGYSRPRTDELLEKYKQTRRRGVHRKYQCSMFLVSRFKKRTEKLKLPSDLDAYTRWLWTSCDNSLAVEDSLDSLIVETRVVPESHLGMQATSNEIDKYRQQSPIAGTRFTHSTRLGRPSRFIATMAVRAYS